MKTSVDFVERIFDIRRQEVSRVLLMSTYLLLIIAAYSTSKAVRDSLFVTQIGTSQLPYVYLLIAGAMGLVSLVYTRAVARAGLHRLVRITSLIAISNLLLFWLMFRQNSAIWFYVLYVWVSLFGAITASQFWLLATHVFDAREARRVFAWIGVGGILG
jgi:AAA family ATP:ADP antiporter